MFIDKFKNMLMATSFQTDKGIILKIFTFWSKEIYYPELKIIARKFLKYLW